MLQNGCCGVLGNLRLVGALVSVFLFVEPGSGDVQSIQNELGSLQAENTRLRRELISLGFNTDEIDRELCQKLGLRCLIGIAPEPAMGQCASLRFFQGRAKDGCGPGMVPASDFALLNRCRHALCSAIPRWSIAVGHGLTLHGQGYGCGVTSSGVDDKEEVGDLICISNQEESSSAANCEAGEMGEVRRTQDVNNQRHHRSDSVYTEQNLDKDHVNTERRSFVRRMMVNAWSGYAQHSWGANELRPKSRSGNSGGIFGKSELGATIVDSLDTLLLMGLDEEAAEARKYIQDQLNFDVDISVSVFETMIRFVGGFLSAFALTNDQLYLSKALELCTRLLPAFQTPTGIPASTVNLRTGARSHWKWVPGGGTNAILSEFGTIELEMLYLSDASGDPMFAKVAENTSSAIARSLDTLGGRSSLVPNFLDVEKGSWGRKDTSLGPYGDSYYEYLLKRWIYRGGNRSPELRAQHALLRDDFDSSIRIIRQKLHKHAPRTPQGDTPLYIADLTGGKITNSMWHLSCFAGGMYALGGATAADPIEAGTYLEDAADITATCRAGYATQPTGLGPERMAFTGVSGVQAGKEKEYILRPETVESFFYLWRTTHYTKYREWAWDVVLAIEKHCRCGVGYCGIKDVTTTSKVAHDDEQQSFFLAETLKYLYLIFSDNSILNLDEWVFNTEAHPFPIRGADAKWSI